VAPQLRTAPRSAAVAAGPGAAPQLRAAPRSAAVAGGRPGVASFETGSTQEDSVKKTILTGILLALPMAAWAADVLDVKPGLWEQTMTMEMTGMPAMPQMTPEQLAQMPPAMRARMEGMMQGGPQTITSKVCQTKESLADAQAYARQQNSCTSKVTSMSATKVEYHTDCTGRFKGSGDFVVERLDAEHTKTTGVIKGVSSMGKKADSEQPITQKMTITGKWVSADCGDVKPFSPPK
jgi:hypothetical protein